MQLSNHSRQNSTSPASNYSSSNGKHKPLNNRETITHGRCPEPRLYPVLAALRIRELSRHLNETEHFPLAVHSSSKKVKTLISNKYTSDHLQAIAKATYGVTRKAELKWYVSHYVWAGSCVLFSEGRYDCAFVKIRLYWKSESFLIFLRSVDHMTVRHSATTS